MLNWELMRAPLNWVIVTVIAAFGFAAMALLFPDLFINRSSQ
jgi:hypothetical protein